MSSTGIAPSAPAPGAAPATTATSISGRQLWRSGRGLLLVGALALAGALLIAVLSSGHRAGFLDPESVTGSGSRAVAQVLRSQGVDVTRAEGVAAATSARAGQTLVLSQPDLLTVEQARELASTDADLVVVEDDPIAGPLVRATIVDGTIVHRRGQ